MLPSCSRGKRLLLRFLAGFVFLFILSSAIIAHIQISEMTHPTITLGTSTRSDVPCAKFPCPFPISYVNSRRQHVLTDTWSGIHSFLTFDYKIANPSSVASRYDFVWGAQQNHLAALRSGNPNIALSYYMPFHRDYGTFSDTGAGHDLNYWKNFHPNWILYKCDRVTPAYENGDPNIPLDFANPDLVSWQIQTYASPASASGYDSIAADNVDLGNWSGACGVYQNGGWVQRYTGQANDPQWRADIVTWLSRMQQALHALPKPLALIPNLAFGGLSPSDSLIRQIANIVDGVLDEGGFTRYGNGYLTNNDWLQSINFIEYVQQQHKPYYIIDQFPSVGRTQIQWALASYLMTKEHTAEMFVSTAQGYGSDNWYTEYGAQIGNPLDSMYLKQNVYWRDYAGGLSLVNPSSSATYTITLPRSVHYVDLYGNRMGSTITMHPHSGQVLLARI